MKTFVISDVHGMIFWKDILAKANSEDQLVFLGDYFDKRGLGPYAASQTENFLEICALARENSNVHLLLGNHDFQYTDLTDSETNSFDDYLSAEYAKALMDNIDLLKIVYIDRKGSKPIIFSHAGVTQNFLDINKIASVDKINEVFNDDPEKFEFRSYYAGEYADIYGDNIWQTPLWIRPNSLLAGAVAGYDQVVGHTWVEDIEKEKSVQGDWIYFTCTFNANCLILE